MKGLLYKELSSKATGIKLKSTEVSSDKRRGVLKSITIEPQKDSFSIEYFVERLDDNGKPFEDVVFKTKQVKFTDMPERGTVEYERDGLTEVSGSYEKVAEEDLVVTEWDNLVGNNLLGSALDYIKIKENL
jgi:hypothetical protein